MCLSHLIYTVRPCLICTCHAMLRPCRSSQGHSTARPSRDSCAVTLRRTAWSEHGMGSAIQTRLHCVNQMGNTHSKPSAARRGNGMGEAWERHATCESAVNMLHHLQTDPTATNPFKLHTSHCTIINIFPCISLNINHVKNISNESYRPQPASYFITIFGIMWHF